MIEPSDELRRLVRNVPELEECGVAGRGHEGLAIRTESQRPNAASVAFLAADQQRLP
jgi:cystathionine beta-lyase/cystathionine gamma-synthase